MINQGGRGSGARRNAGGKGVKSVNGVKGGKGVKSVNGVKGGKSGKGGKGSNTSGGGKRPLNAYQSFMSEHMRGGMTMAEANEEWRKNK